jgi:hypothetical protein
MVISPQYLFGEDFKDGLALTANEEDMFYIDVTGEILWQRDREVMNG